MTAARARWYDGRTSAPREAEVAIERAADGPRLTVRAMERRPGTPADAATDAHEGEASTGTRAAAVASYACPLAAATLAERVGGAPRTVELPDGGTLEILDNAAFDRALEAVGATTVEHVLGRLEDRWRYALAAVAVVVVGTWALVQYGVPALASRAVAVLPPEVDRQLGRGGLELLDRAVLEPTRLPPERQAELRAAFREIAAAAPDGDDYRLEFRRGGEIGPNALALPSGIVVLTDELVALAEHDDELRGVLAHEVGHLVHRHSMRMLLQSSATALLAVGLLGDASAATSLVASVPTVLVQARHSRDFEREADDYAYAWLRQAGVDPQRLAKLLRRLHDAHGGDDWSYLSSHPRLEERVRP